METTALASASRSRSEHKESTQSLDALAIGASGRLAMITGDQKTRRRLMEMGFCNGVTIEAVRRAPLGDPTEFRVRGYFVSLRSDQARCVHVSLAS